MKSQKLRVVARVSLHVLILGIVAISFFALGRRSMRTSPDQAKAEVNPDRAPAKEQPKREAGPLVEVIDLNEAGKSPGDVRPYPLLYRRPWYPDEVPRLHPAEITNEWGPWPATIRLEESAHPED